MRTIGTWPPVVADRLREARFPIRFRGYPPAAVHDLLRQAADQLLDLHRQLAAARAETDRIKKHLRQWQRDHAVTCRRDPDYQPVRARRPVNHASARVAIGKLDRRQPVIQH